jgi:pimeloyl-ACP methyl ester carboxylesterase
MTTFALMHGAWHSGWHWHAVAELLKDHGHRAVAPDLPIDDPDAGGEAWAAAMIEGVGDDDGRLVVVAHSMAGLAMPLVAMARPVAKLVFRSRVDPTVLQPCVPARCACGRIDAVVVSHRCCRGDV